MPAMGVVGGTGSVARCRSVVDGRRAAVAAYLSEDVV